MIDFATVSTAILSDWTNITLVWCDVLTPVNVSYIKSSLSKIPVRVTNFASSPGYFFGYEF